MRPRPVPDTAASTQKKIKRAMRSRMPFVVAGCPRGHAKSVVRLYALRHTTMTIRRVWPLDGSAHCTTCKSITLMPARVGDAPARWVRVNQARIFEPAQQCRYCGTFWGGAGDCKATVCMACGASQCMGNGLGNGQCSLCYVGLLPGWSGSDGTCTYKGCGSLAVARGRGRKKICAVHAAHQKIGQPNYDGWHQVLEF